MSHAAGSRFHQCERWLRFGMQCPFIGGEDEDIEGDDPPDDVPPTGVQVPRVPPLQLLAAKRARELNVLSQAEEIASRAAEAIPVFVEGQVQSLAERLGVPGALAVGTGVAAGFAVRQIAKQIRQRGGFGGGFNFPSVLDPAKAFRLP